MVRIGVKYPACHRQWCVDESSDSRPVVRLHLTGNQKSVISGDGVNAGILSLKDSSHCPPLHTTSHDGQRYVCHSIGPIFDH